jgi:hypothetical protein
MTMADWVLEILRNAPLVSAGAWLLLAALQVYRDRWHTWTETFFLFCCAFAGIYAIGDWLFFNAPPDDPSLAVLYARISLTGITLAVNFFFLFTLVYVDRMRQSYWIFMLITGGVLLMLLTVGITRVTPPPPTSGALYIASFNEIPFAIYLAYIIIYAVAGIRNLYRLRQIVRKSSPALTRRATGLMATFTLVLVLGLGTNGYLGIMQIDQIPPPLSTLLIFVAGSAYYTIFPVGRERISEAIRRFQARRYSIKAAFITYEDGTLIGSKVRPGEKVIDQDLFGATLDVIQNYMKTSVPILRGKSLSSITHGHYTLVLERARFTYLTVVLEGEETDQLRRQMRDLLLGFELNNRQVLAAWQGIPDEAKGTEDVFTDIFVEAPIA